MLQKLLALLTNRQRTLRLLAKSLHFSACASRAQPLPHDLCPPVLQTCGRKAQNAMTIALAFSSEVLRDAQGATEYESQELMLMFCC